MSCINHSRNFSKDGELQQRIQAGLINLHREYLAFLAEKSIRIHLSLMQYQIVGHIHIE